LTVVDSLLVSVTLNPTTVLGGSTSIGTVKIKDKAQQSSITVTLSSNNTAAVVPTTVVVPAGATSATFTVTTVGVPTQTVATISATLGITLTAQLTINPPALTTLVLAPTSVVGGSPSVGTVTLSGPAPAGGAVIQLSSNQSAATVPATVTVLAGQTTANFTINTQAVTTQTAATISATLGGTTLTAGLTIQT
jgi:predicted acyltransferase